MKTLILILFVIGVGLLSVGRWTDEHQTDAATSVSSSIVPYALGVLVLCADLALLAAYALWRLFV